MSSSSPKFTPPSPFTPFLRRFTDERARDLNETIALFSEVRRTYFASPWSKDGALERVSNVIAEWVTEAVEIPLVLPLGEALDRCQRAVLALESTIFSFPEIDWSRATLSLKEQVDLRRFLRAQQHFLANQERATDLLATTLVDVMAALLSDLPTMPAGADQATLSVPLVALLPDPGIAIARLTGTLCVEELADVGLFTTLQQHLYENACRASGVLPDEPLRKPLTTADQAELAPEDLVATYLAGTPFADLFLTPLPFAIPDAVRFEHTHVIGGTGHGKTTLLQDQIVADLARPDPPAMVVIDPKGIMVRRIQQLAVFDPDTGPLSDRLIVINPEDVRHPPALNMFAPPDRRVGRYPEEVRRQIENNTVSLYHYIFGSIASALTQKQATAFSFIVRLLFDVPQATIHTLLELVETETPRRFQPFIDRQSATARSFFQHHFYHPTEFRETKQQIAHRLYGILQYPEFDAMFSTPERKLDMFDALQSRKIVLVNAAKPLLGKEASQLFGRYMIALTLAAAFERSGIDRSSWNPAFLVIDEAHEFADETKTQELLQQAREFNLGVTMAHQQIEGQLSLALRSTFASNTSIKYAGGVSGHDASVMARDMRCDAAFILGQRKTTVDTHFACYVRGFTEHPVSIALELGATDKQPKMSPTALTRLIARNRAALSTTRQQSPTPTTAAADQPETPTTAVDGAAVAVDMTPTESAPLPTPAPADAIDPDTGSHTEAATKWGE